MNIRDPEFLKNYKFIDKQGVYSGERGVHNPGKEGYRYSIIHGIYKIGCFKHIIRDWSLANYKVGGPAWLVI